MFFKCVEGRTFICTHKSGSLLIVHQGNERLGVGACNSIKIIEAIDFVYQVTSECHMRKVYMLFDIETVNRKCLVAKVIKRISCQRFAVEKRMIHSSKLNLCQKALATKDVARTSKAQASTLDLNSISKNIKHHSVESLLLKN